MSTPTCDVYRLNEILKEKYKERISINYPKASLNAIEGTLDSKKIRIVLDYYYGFLLFSTTLNSREILDELTPLLTKVMNNSAPICSYNLLKRGTKDENAMPTIEWDLNNPEERIEELISGHGFADYVVSDLRVLYNPKTDAINEAKTTSMLQNKKILK